MPNARPMASWPSGKSARKPPVATDAVPINTNRNVPRTSARYVFIALSSYRSVGPLFRAANHGAKSIPNAKAWKAEQLRHRSCLRRPVTNIRDPASIWDLLSPAGGHLPAGEIRRRDRDGLVAANASGVQSRRERL